MSGIAEYLPPQGEYLPYWLYFTALISGWNAIRFFIALPDLAPAKALYASPVGQKEATALAARTFAVWTFLTSVIRIYAAIHLHERDWYLMALWTFVVGFGHFVSEFLVYGTVKLPSGAVSPFVVAGSSIVWLGLSYNAYTS